MINLNNFMHRAREIYVYRHEPEYMRPLAELLWRALLVGVAIGLVSVLIFAATVFWDVLATLGNAAGGPARQPAVLDRAKLQAALQMIEERSAAFEARRANPTPVVDPSR